jgi:hypothetical protein
LSELFIGTTNDGRAGFIPDSDEINVILILSKQWRNAALDHIKYNKE